MIYNIGIRGGKKPQPKHPRLKTLVLLGLTLELYLWMKQVGNWQPLTRKLQHVDYFCMVWEQKNIANTSCLPPVNRGRKWD